MSRFRGILFGTAVVAVFLSGGLAALSLLCRGLGLVGGQLLLAGVVEFLISYLFLAAGVGALDAAVRALRRSSDSTGDRLLFGFCFLFCGICWVTIGVNGLVSPEILPVFFDA